LCVDITIASSNALFLENIFAIIIFYEIYYAFLGGIINFIFQCSFGNKINILFSRWKA
jgi:hypothetical protein